MTDRARSLSFILLGCIGGWLLGFLPHDWLIPVAILLVAVGGVCAGMLIENQRAEQRAEAAERKMGEKEQKEP